jgi:hypothetical protein
MVDKTFIVKEPNDEELQEIINKFFTLAVAKQLEGFSTSKLLKYGLSQLLKQELTPAFEQKIIANIRMSDEELREYIRKEFSSMISVTEWRNFVDYLRILIEKREEKIFEKLRDSLMQVSSKENCGKIKESV